MLSLYAITTLADSDKIPYATLRFYLRLIRDYDLRRFRALPVLKELEKEYGRAVSLIAKDLVLLVKWNLLEDGGVIQNHSYHNRRKGHLYKIPPRSLLSGEDLKRWKRENAEQAERDQVLPAPFGRKDGPIHYPTA